MTSTPFYQPSCWQRKHRKPRDLFYWLKNTQPHTNFVSETMEAKDSGISSLNCLKRKKNYQFRILIYLFVYELNLWINMRLPRDICIYIYVCVSLCVCIYAHMCLCIHMYTHAYICICTHIYILAHIILYQSTRVIYEKQFMSSKTLWFRWGDLVHVVT